MANGSDGGTSGPVVAANSGGGENHRCFAPNRVNAFWGDAAKAISGIQGMMNGGGEAVTIIQSDNPFAPSSVAAASCAIAPLTGTATSFWFGTASSGKLATFEGPTGTLGTVNQIAELSASGNGGVAVLAPVGQSVCYFTAIQGGFFGGGEWVQIRSELIGSVSHWVLRTGKGGASSFVGASARCFARDQR